MLMHLRALLYLGMGKAIPTLKPRMATVDLRRVKPPEKMADPFYHSNEWRELCSWLKETRWPLLIIRQGHCCEDPDCRADHRLGQRIYFDHVVELRDGGAPLDPDNIMGRCGSSHTRKTLRVRGERMADVVKGEGGSKV